MVIQIDREKRNACFKMGNINTAQYLKKLEEETVKNIFKFTGYHWMGIKPPPPCLFSVTVKRTVLQSLCCALLGSLQD